MSDMNPELTMGADGKPCCNCEQCRTSKQGLEKAGVPSTWRGFRIMTEHEAAQALAPYFPEAGDVAS